MTTTYSTNLKLALPGNGEQTGVWGTTMNTNLGTLLEQAIAGIQTITMSNVNYVLSNLNGVTDEARNAALIVTGSLSASYNLLVPNGQTKLYVIVNNTSGGQDIGVQTWSGSGVTGTGTIATIPNGSSIMVYCTGSNCYTIAPYTAYTAVPIAFQGWASGTTLHVTSAPTAPLKAGQTIYNPGILYTTSGFPASTTIVNQLTGTTGGVGTYTINNASTVGTADYPQPITAVNILTQIATLDYVQSKTQSVYLQGAPSADTATAAAYEGTMANNILIISKYYVSGNPIGLGQYINGINVADGTFVSAWGSGTAGNATFTGYISGTTLTVTSGSVTGTITNSQYLICRGANLTAGTKITAGSGLSWTVNNSQTLGSATSPVTFEAYGPILSASGALNDALGWVQLTNNAQPLASVVTRTPMISFLSPLQLSNVLFASNIAYLLGTLGTQSDSAVNILGGTIANTNLTNCTGITATAGATDTGLATNQFATASGVPAGTIIQFAGTTAPAGYLACPLVPTTVSRTTYARLFAAIGTTWGAGDGSTTFGLPYFAQGLVGIQANNNVGSTTVGQNLAHTHDYTTRTGLAVQSGSSTQCWVGTATAQTGSNGGPNNLAAGAYVMYCVKY